MTGAIFELDKISELPLWAQVLIASRIARRSVLIAPADADAEVKRQLLAACDAVDRCVSAGQRLKAEQKAIAAGMELGQLGVAGSAGEAVYFAGDAVHAANDSMDFSAAESACVSSVQKAIAAAGNADGWNPVQVRIFLAMDLDLLRFFCKEERVGRYDGLKGVEGRMVPVRAD